MENKTLTIKIPCISCNKETNHLLEWRKQWTDDNGKGIWVDYHVDVLKCCGCDQFTFRETSLCSEDIFQCGEDEYGEPIMNDGEKIIYYPERTKKLVSEISEIHMTPKNVRKVYSETISAFNYSLPLICGIGIRSIIEAICLEEKIEVDGIKKKIKAMLSKGIITKSLEEGLQENRLLGNYSVHQLYAGSSEELKAAIKLINILIRNHYSVPKQTAILKKGNRIDPPHKSRN